MKKFVFVLVLSLIFVFGSLAQAQAKEIFSLENGDLVVYETREKKRIPGVPQGVSADTAYQLASGKLKETVVKDERGKKTYKFSYPVREKVVFSDTLIKYDGRKWIQNKIPRIEENLEWDLTIFWIWFPALGILIISLINIMAEIGSRKLLVFYSTVFGSMLAALVGSLVGGAIIGSIGGLIAGVFAAVFAAGLAGGLAGVFTGGLAVASAGGFTGLLADGLAGEGNYEIIIYLIFLMCVCMISFAIAEIAGIVKRNMPAIKKWLEQK